MTLMPSDALETLRQVNENLRSALLRLRPERGHCSAVTPRDFSDILSQLTRARECLRVPTTNSEISEPLERESREYRSNLEKLKQFLPSLHVRLLAEKSRLETLRSHAMAAIAWSRASRQTF
jgi:hypothetical protein